MIAIEEYADDLDLHGLLSELVDECYAARFEPWDAGDPAASCAILADWLEENDWVNLAAVFRSPICDYEGWMVDVLTVGLERAEHWAADWLREFG